MVDRYAKTVVIKLYSAIWWSRLSQVLPSLMRLTKAHHVVLRLSRALKDQGAAFGLSDGQLLSAKALPEAMSFLENGLRSNGGEGFATRVSRNLLNVVLGRPPLVNSQAEQQKAPGLSPQ